MNDNNEDNNRDKPHRVIYTQKGKRLALAFSDYAAALSFAETATDPIIQLASENPKPLLTKGNRKMVAAFRSASKVKYAPGKDL